MTSESSRLGERERQIGVGQTLVDAKTKLNFARLRASSLHKVSLEASSVLLLHPATVIKLSTSPSLSTLQLKIDRSEAEGVLPDQGLGPVEEEGSGSSWERLFHSRILLPGFEEEADIEGTTYLEAVPCLLLFLGLQFF